MRTNPIEIAHVPPPDKDEGKAFSRRDTNKLGGKVNKKDEAGGPAQNTHPLSPFNGAFLLLGNVVYEALE